MENSNAAQRYQKDRYTRSQNQIQSHIKQKKLVRSMYTQIFAKQLFSERVKYDQPLPSVELCGKDSNIHQNQFRNSAQKSQFCG